MNNHNFRVPNFCFLLYPIAHGGLPQSSIVHIPLHLSIALRVVEVRAELIGSLLRDSFLSLIFCDSEQFEGNHHDIPRLDR